MDRLQIACWRMANLLLLDHGCGTPEEVVRSLGVVQSQDFGPAKWSIGHRLSGWDDSAVGKAFNAGRLLRTHVLRPTWHFVLPEDILLMLAVTGPRVQVANRHMNRQLELNETVLNRCNELIGDALAGGNFLTRQEIRFMLVGHGIDASGQRLAYIVMNAELEGMICSGPLKGKQHTYALLEERSPNARRIEDPDEALAEFVLRYFTSHGPATEKDLRSWSSLTLAQIRRGIELVRDRLQSMEFDGLTFWFVNDPPENAVDAPVVHLLQGYDEYLMGYFESRGVADIANRLATLHPDNMVANGIVTLDGQITGHWRRRLTPSTVDFEVLVNEPLDSEQSKRLECVATRFGEFLGLCAPVTLTMIR